MLRTVKFNYYLSLITIKINNIISDSFLSTKFYRKSVQKIIPKMLFLFSHFFSKLLRVLCKVGVTKSILLSFHNMDPLPPRFARHPPPREGLLLSQSFDVNPKGRLFIL